MKNLIAAIIATGVLLGASPAWSGASFTNGNQLYSKCSSGKSDVVNFAYCFGYIAGIGDAGLGGAGGVSSVKFCPPLGVTHQQAEDVVVKWLIEKPQHRRYEAAGIVAAALSKVWPCN